MCTKYTNLLFLKKNLNQNHISLGAQNCHSSSRIMVLLLVLLSASMIKKSGSRIYNY